MKKDLKKEVVTKTGRWFTVLCWDYPTEYHKLIPNHTSHAATGTAQTEKEVRHESGSS